MVTHMPWDRNLGGPRVQLELGEELSRRGCVVEKFDLDAAFGSSRIDRWLRRWASNFPQRAKAYVRENAGRFDIIDAHQFTLPFTKAQLRFDGLLVARSVGLLPLYLDFEAARRRRWPGESKGSLPARASLSWDQRRMRSQFYRSLDACDLVNVPNPSEEEWVHRHFPAKAAVTIPFGLSRERTNAFESARADPEGRRRDAIVASVASWEPRKGSRDWGRIVKALRALVPRARFLFLGTGLPRAAVLRDLDAEDGDWLQVVPRFRSEDLPGLLAGATVGAFPSYLDGFGYGVLEMLASGLPTVVYDVPGPRDIASRADRRNCTPVGDTDLFAGRLAAILAGGPREYALASRQSVTAASLFDLEVIADRTLQAYANAQANAVRGGGT